MSDEDAVMSVWLFCVCVGVIRGCMTVFLFFMGFAGCLEYRNLVIVGVGAAARRGRVSSCFDAILTLLQRRLRNSARQRPLSGMAHVPILHSDRYYPVKFQLASNSSHEYTSKIPVLRIDPPLQPPGGRLNSRLGRLMCLSSPANIFFCNFMKNYMLSQVY